MSKQSSPARQLPKPALKINISRASSFTAPDGGVSGLAITSTSTPPTKILLKAKPTTPSAITSPLSATTKAGRQTKPTQKLVEATKREFEAIEEGNGPSITGQPAKKIRLKTTTPKTPQVVIKNKKGKIPTHPPGTGYDSEASDREEDPVIEEQFILRMIPGDHCEYVRKAIEENRFEAKPGDVRQGAEISLKFFEEESRRAVFWVKGQAFAAVMLDLPTIIESMKTWDKKTLMKSADICQMLLIFKMVKTEEEAKNATLPKTVEGGQRWPHGLTPPMHDCVHRRFAPKMSRKEIMDKEKEVDRLLAMDLEAEQSRWEWIDDRPVDDDSVDEQDAEGDVDDAFSFAPGEEYEPQEIDEAGLEADLVAAFEAEGVDAPTPGTQLEVTTPLTGAVTTPAAPPQDDGDESGDADDDEEDEEDEGVDEEEQARLDEIQGVEDIIADLRKQLAQKEAEQQKIAQPILRQRIEATIRKLKSEIQLKLSSIGQKEDD